MKLYVNDLLGDTTTLSDGEFGSYVSILLAMWRAGGWLSLDQARRAARVGPGRWSKRWSILAAYFAVRPDGQVTNRRVLEELGKAGQLSKTRASAANSRWQNSSVPEPQKVVPAGATDSEPKPMNNIDPAPIDAYKRARVQSSEADPEGTRDRVVPFPLPQQDAVSEGEWPSCEYRAMVAVFAGALNHPLFDPSKITSVKFHREAPGFLKRWRDAGFSWAEDVVLVSRARCDEADGPIQGMKFFDGAIASAHTARTAPFDPPPRGNHHVNKLARKHANLAASIAGAELAAEFRRGGGFGGGGGD